jgi:hypothetical protein
MLAFHVFGAKEIAVYVVAVVIVIVAVSWYGIRRRSKG